MSNQTPEATKRYRERNRDSILQYLRDYIQRPDVKERRKQYKRDHPEKQMIMSARHRAKKRGIPFDITDKDILPIPTHCPILGIPLFITEGKLSSNSPTLDQVNPGLGYVKDNVRVISHKANTMKQNNTIEDFERFIRYMKGLL